MRGEASLELRKDLARHLRAGHPWVFRKAIEKAPRGLLAGAIVDVVEGGRFVARGYHDPHSAISVRILTREPAEVIDDAFWREPRPPGAGAAGRSGATAPPATGSSTARTTDSPGWSPTATATSPC